MHFTQFRIQYPARLDSQIFSLKTSTSLVADPSSPNLLKNSNLTTHSCRFPLLPSSLSCSAVGMYAFLALLVISYWGILNYSCFRRHFPSYISISPGLLSKHFEEASEHHLCSETWNAVPEDDKDFLLLAAIKYRIFSRAPIDALPIMSARSLIDTHLSETRKISAPPPIESDVCFSGLTCHNRLADSKLFVLQASFSLLPFDQPGTLIQTL